jgi:hypothetical protein
VYNSTWDLGFKRNLGKVAVVSLGLTRVYGRRGGPCQNGRLFYLEHIDGVPFNLKPYLLCVINGQAHLTNIILRFLGIEIIERNLDFVSVMCNLRPVDLNFHNQWDRNFTVIVDCQQAPQVAHESVLPVCSGQVKDLPSKDSSAA